jgi:tetratricopeptide (TPR) repeat protein
MSRHFAGSLTASLTTVLLLTPCWTTLGEAKGAEVAKEAEDPVPRLQELNRAGMQYFDDLNYAMAEKTLLEALALVEKSNLGGAPAALATHGNLAVLYSAGLAKPDKAVFHFKKALAIKPDLRLSKQRATPETEANLARAKAEMAGGSGASGGTPVRPGEPTVEEGGGDFRCPTGGEVEAGDEITLRCLTTANVQAATVMLYYKSSGAEEFEVARMAKEGSGGEVTTWVGTIPAARTQGTSVLIYFEAYDDAGNSLAASGNEGSPSVIAVKGGGGGAMGAGPPPVEEEWEEEEEEEEYEDFDDSNPLAALERERWREHEGSKGSWWIGLGIGSGLGYASGDYTEAFGPRYGVRFTSGVAWAATGHLVPEFGYFVGRRTALALTGRNQGIFGGPKGTATGAHSILLRVLFFTEDSEKVRWYFATAAGWGEGFRMQVTASVKDPVTGLQIGTVKDTVRGGPFLAGIGGGMQLKLTRHWRWTVETQALLGFTDISAVLDLTTGARWQY